MADALDADTKMHLAAGFMLAIETAEMLIKAAGPFLTARELAEVLRSTAGEMGLAAEYERLQAARAELLARKKDEDERRV